MDRDKNNHLRLMGRPTDYQKLGIDPAELAQIEDGCGEMGRQDWWCFDARLDDGPC
jgi:hypothetical protein